jgi:hippurate hydrolase
MESLVEMYQQVHANPELSFHEEETSARIAAELREIGASVTTDVGGLGVVGVIRNGEGPILMLRADLDALPITEETGLVFASTKRAKNSDGTEVGVMHACGHDLHMTNLIGTGRYLASHLDQWQGTLIFVGQPAEERGAGAQAMLKDGLFTRFAKPDYAIALHVDPQVASGQVALKSGYALANVDSVDVTLFGKGGHGALPHTTIDPIVQAAQFVLAVQTIVSREIKPLEPAVITVGSIRSGTKHNIISDRCQMQLTVRSYSDEVRTKLLDGIRRKAKAVAMGAGAPEPEVVISEGTPAVFNSEELAQRITEVFQRVLGDQNVKQGEPAMAGEDFSRYGRAGVPILMYRLGTTDARLLSRYNQLGQPPPPLHSPTYFPDVEKSLATGVVTMTHAAMALLKPAPQ